MSFGWAAGDIVLALQVLYKVGHALNDARGASSVYQESSAFLDSLQKTLEHLRLFASSLNSSISPGKLHELQKSVSQIRVPVTRFVEDVKKFEPALAADSPRSKVLAIPRKIQWSFQMESRLKKLQDTIVVPMLGLNLVFGVHMLSVVSTMRTELPQHMQSDFSKVLRQHFPGLLTEGLQPWTSAALQHKEEILERQALIADEAMSNADENRQLVLKGMDCCRQEGLHAINSIRTTLETFSSRIDSLPSRFEDKMRSLRIMDDNAQARLAAAISTHSGELKEIGQTIARIPHSRFDALSPCQTEEGFRPDPEFRDLCRQFQICAWLLIASIQQLVRKLSEILVPYLTALSKAIRLPQQLLLLDDKFMFENALGYTFRLSTAQFQDWNLFYRFLKDSFKDLPGFSRVINRKFRILNQFNGAIIEAHSWKAAVQPGARVMMAMLLNRPGMTGSRCPSCRGQVRSLKDSGLIKCSLCRKLIIASSKMPERLAALKGSAAPRSAIPWDEFLGEIEDLTYEPLVGEKRQSSDVLSVDDLMKDGLNDDGSDEEMRAFKLVTWQPEDFSGLTILYQPTRRKPNIDIVAIHGLHGHAWDSFASDFDLGEPPNREINWLQDILPGRILKKSRSMLGTELSVRVMTFGYETEHWFDAPAVEFENPCLRLQRHLDAERVDDPDRPLILVGHGLGGIIAREAALNMRGTRGADHWLVKGCMFFDATIKEITTSLQGGSYPPGLGADQRETYPSTKSTLKYIWNNFKKARRAMEITVLDVVSRETRKHPHPGDAVGKCYHGDCALLEVCQYDITSITKKNEAIYIPNVMDLLIDMVLWNSDLGPPQNHDTRLSFIYKDLGPPKNYDTDLSCSYKEPQSSSVSERYGQQRSNESVLLPPQIYFGIKRKAQAGSSLTAAIQPISSSKKDVPGPPNPSGRHPRLSSIHISYRGFSIVPKNSNSSRNHRPRARRYTWFCCQCGSGPSEINCVTDCLDCYHPRCAGCSVATTKS